MIDNKNGTKDLILTLQGLRGILFLNIFFFHSGIFLKGYVIYDKFLVGGGCFAVSAFFALSGFVNGLSNKIINNRHEYTKFLKKKISKIFLPHIIFLILSLPLHYYYFLYTKKGKITLLLDALLVQSWFSDKEVWLSYNGVTWFLSVLMFCCASTPIIQWGENRTKRYNRDKQYAILYAFLILFCIGSVILCVTVKDNVTYWLYAFPPVRLLDFFGGYVLAGLFKMKDKDRNKKCKLRYCSASVLELMLFIMYMGFMFAYPFVSESFRRQAFQMPITFCLVYIFAKGKGYISKLLSTKWIALLGNHSCYYYISHEVISGWIYKIYERTPMIDRRIFAVDFMVVIICLLITLTSRRIYEKMLMK